MIQANAVQNLSFDQWLVISYTCCTLKLHIYRLTYGWSCHIHGVGCGKGENTKKYKIRWKLSTILAVSYRVIDGMRFKVREGMGQLKILDLNFAKLTHVENNLKIKRLYRIFFSLVKCNTPSPHPHPDESSP